MRLHSLDTGPWQPHTPQTEDTGDAVATTPVAHARALGPGGRP
jgi:hypothetical protein